jgi:hypothetical protein
MSSVVVITPIVIASWPVISAAVTAAVGSLGFAIVRGASSGPAESHSTAKSNVRAEIELEESEILQGAMSDETIVVEKDGMRATFSRDARGALKLCMEGEGYSKTELQRVGHELVDRVTQQYVYHRVVTELKERHMSIVDENVSADRTVTIRVRNV